MSESIALIESHIHYACNLSMLGSPHYVCIKGLIMYAPIVSLCMRRFEDINLLKGILLLATGN